MRPGMRPASDWHPGRYWHPVLAVDDGALLGHVLGLDVADAHDRAWEWFAPERVCVLSPEQRSTDTP